MATDSERYDLFGNVGLDSSAWDTGIAGMLKSSGLLEAKWLAVGGAVGAVASGLVSCATEAANFESAMGNIKTVVGKGQDSFVAQMSDDLKSLSQTMPFSQTELAGTLYDIISYGVPAADAMKVLAQSAKTAVGGFTNVNDAFTLFGSIIKGYGLSWDDVNEVSDKMFFVAARGASTIEQLSSAIGGAVPFAKQLGIDLNEVYAVMATLPGVTGTTAEAATQLTSAMTAMLDPNAQMVKLYKELGVLTGEEFIKKMGGLQQAFYAIKSYAEGHNIAVGTMLGRKEAQLAFFNITGAQAKEYAQNLKDVGNAVGLSTDAYEMQMETTANSWKTLKNQLTLIMSEIGETIIPTAKEFFQAANDIANLNLTGAATNIVEFFDSIGENFYLYNKVKEFYDAVGNLINYLGTTKLGIAVKEWFGDVGDFFSGAFDSIQKIVTDFLKADFFTALKQHLDLNVWTPIKEVYTKIKDFVQPVLDLLKPPEMTEMQKTAQLRQMQNNTIDYLNEFKDMVEKGATATGILNTKTEKNVELTKEQKEAIERLRKATEEYKNNAQEKYKQEWANINSELYNVKISLEKVDGLAKDLSEMDKDQNGFLSVLEDSTVASGDIRADFDAMPELIGKVKRNTELERDALHEAAEKAREKKELWMEISGAVGDVIKSMPLLDRAMKAVLGTATDVARQIAAGGTTGWIGAISTTISAGFEATAQKKEAILATYESYTSSYAEIMAGLKEAGMDNTDDVRAINDLWNEINTSKSFTVNNASLINRNNILAGLVSSLDAAYRSTEELQRKTDESTDSVDKQTKAVGSLEIAWENMLKTSLDLWDSWEKDQQTIFAALEKMAYFKIDVSTTEADEQIAASIQNLMDYSETLNTTSDAYKDIRNNITEMLIQYAATGASANETATQLALAILNVRDMIDEMTDATKKEALQKQLESMISRFREMDDILNTTKTLTIDVQTTGDTDALDLIDDSPEMITKKTKLTSKYEDRLHTGGFPRMAHSGYLASSEVDVRMLKNEMVLRPEATDKFGAQRLLDFNKSLDPSVLGGQRPVKVVFHNATKQSWAEIVDESIYPRMKEKERRFEVAGNPY